MKTSQLVKHLQNAGDLDIPWFFTGVTYPLVLQSTKGGSVAEEGRKDNPWCSFLFEVVERDPETRKRNSSAVRSPN